MQIERKIIHSSEPGRPCFGLPPKDLNSINMTFIMNKLVWSMVDAGMFLVSGINESIVVSPTVGMYNSLEIYAPLMTPCSVAFRQSGTISVKILPLRLKISNTTV